MTRHDDAQRFTGEAVAQYFEKRGVSADVRQKGLRGIIAEWEAIARGAERYELTLDDWLNDVDLRDIIDGAMAVASKHERDELRGILERADEAFRAVTVESVRSLWGTSHDRIQQWWYFRCPTRPGEMMRADLTAAGVTLRR